MTDANLQAAHPPDVTIIVPAYNAQRHLAATLESLLAQRGVAFEVLVVDDCSTDGSRRVVEMLAVRDARLRYCRMPANSGGPAGPRNLGVEQARTEWVAFCDADDLWHRDKLHLQLERACASNATLICTAIDTFRDGGAGRDLSREAPQRPAYRNISLWQMLLKNRVATSSVLCRREALRALGGFNADPGMIAVEDYDMWLRMMAQLDARIERLDVPLVAYRLLPGSLSSAKWLQAIKIVRVHRDIFATKGWRIAFPFAAPVLLVCYIASWLYLRQRSIRQG